MSLLECKRHAELKQALSAGHWPQAASDELRAHVKSCRSCGDTAAISMALRTAKTQALPEHPMPSSNLLWWRAQLRQRQVRMEKLSRPILRAQILALLLTFCICAGIAWKAMRWGSLTDEADQLSASMTTFVVSLNPLMLVVCLALVVLMGSALIYAMLERE